MIGSIATTGIFITNKYDSIKPEEQARPLPSKAVVTANSEDLSTEKPSAPNLKVTPEKEQKIKEMLDEGKNVKVIAKKFHLSEKTIRRYKKRLSSDN